MAYVYRHIRLDKNEPFYIGIGSSSDKKFIRAFSKKGRSNFWRNIVNKTKYEVEILFDDITWEQACEKEKEFITLYGRKDLGLGTLTNLTNGGEGILGYKNTPELLILRSKLTKGSGNGKAKPCIHFETSLKFNCLKEGCNYFNYNYGAEASRIRRKHSNAHFYFIGEYFKPPTKKEIGIKLGKLRIGNQNWKGKKLKI
jgi:hypothetical protein